MDLPSTFQYGGWQIRYSLLSSQTALEQDQFQTRHVVFVHGTPWSSAVYRPIIEALLAKGSYKVLAYDLPGYGHSQNFESGTTQPTGGFAGDTSFKFQAEALAGLLKHVGLNDRNENAAPAVVAHDIAGAIVLRAHLLHQCEFDSMMLLDTNTVLPWGDGFYQLARSQPQPFMQLPLGIFEYLVRGVIRSACYSSDALKNGWEDVLLQPWVDGSSDDIRKERQISFVRQIAQANDDDVAEMLAENSYANVRCDVKIVWGEQDQWIPREKMENLAKRLGSRAKEFVTIPKAGHLVMLDQPERFAIEVFDWLARPNK